MDDDLERRRQLGLELQKNLPPRRGRRRSSGTTDKASAVGETIGGALELSSSGLVGLVLAIGGLIAAAFAAAFFRRRRHGN